MGQTQPKPGRADARSEAVTSLSEERLWKLLRDLADDMTSEDLKLIKFRQQLPHGVNERATHPLDLFDYYQRRGDINLQRERQTVRFLSRILDPKTFDGNVRLLRHVQRYEERYRQELAETGRPGAARTETRPQAPAVHQLPTTSMAAMSLSEQASAAPAPSGPCPSGPRPSAPAPAAAAPRPPASAVLEPQTPALPSPLPANVRYQAKRAAGPVCVLGPDLGSGVRLSRPVGLAYHAGTDRLYVASYGSKQVVTCGTRGQDPRVLYEVSWPRDVAVSGDGERVYVATILSSPYFHTLTASGELVRKVTSVPGGKLGRCWAVTCYQQQVAVLTAGPARVVIFSRDGDRVRSWSLGNVDGQAMAVDGDGRLYITDRMTGAVIVYSWEGEFRERFGEVEMENPKSWGICVDGDGHVCVSRYEARRVDVYGPDRRLLTSLGGEEGDAPGQFTGPRGLCLLPDGRLVVSDQCNNRLQIF